MPQTTRKTGVREIARRSIFPPRPRGLKGRRAEIATLARNIEARRPARIALVGPGGCGKSMLALDIADGIVASRAASASTASARRACLLRRGQAQSTSAAS
jgi:MoxR-like ATPase